MTMKNSAAFFTMALISAVAMAQPADPDMMLTLKKLYPSTNFKSVSATPVPDMYEVVMGKNVAYVDRTGRYFFFGKMFDMPNQRDLTESRVSEVNKIDTSSLPLNDAVKSVRGSGKRVLYVFSDPDCPFCKQLESNMASLDDVTIYTFMYPLVGLHPDARRKAIGVWCSKDREKSWDLLMRSGKEPAVSECDHPIDRNIALASSLGINGTPTMIAADGKKAAGAMSASRISDWLDSRPEPVATR